MASSHKLPFMKYKQEQKKENFIINSKKIYKIPVEWLSVNVQTNKPKKIHIIYLQTNQLTCIPNRYFFSLYRMIQQEFFSVSKIYTQEDLQEFNPYQSQQGNQNLDRLKKSVHGILMVSIKFIYPASSNQFISF